jgi:hypothetical protein
VSELKKYLEQVKFSAPFSTTVRISIEKEGERVELTGPSSSSSTK